MKDEAAVRQTLRQWVRDTSPKLGDGPLEDSSPLFKGGILQSIHVMDLILLIEHLSERSIDVEKLQTGLFASIDVIIDKFFTEPLEHYVD